MASTVIDQQKHWRACKLLVQVLRTVDADNMDAKTFVYMQGLLVGLLVRRASDTPEGRDKALKAICDLARHAASKDPAEWLEVGEE